jgi:glycosyltransferase involved in cell wall biosynthesis
MMSDQEGFGLPPLEAMGSGCVPICRDSGGVRAYMIGKLKESLLPLNSDIDYIIDFADKLQHRNEWALLSSFAKQVFVDGLNKSNNRAELFCNSF